MGQESDEDPIPGLPPTISLHEGNSPGTPPLVALNILPEDDSSEPPPDDGYGWVVVSACFTINCFSWGVTAVSL
jgi:hypothetical protein